MTLKTHVLSLLQYAQGDNVQTYLERWLAQSLRLTDGLFDPVSGHNHNGTGTNGPTVSSSPGVPTGGTTGQVLTKNSATNYDTSWQTPAPPTWGSP